MITLHQVAKSYSGETNIGPVDVQLPAGGITALVGPNGAGKSTLLTMVGRLLDIDAGTIEIGGLNVATTKSKDLAKVVSILRQENHFVTKLTVRQLVGFGRFPYTGGDSPLKTKRLFPATSTSSTSPPSKTATSMNSQVASGSGPT